jgi:hypothetical protein
MKTIRLVATALAIPFVIASAQQQLATTARVCCTKDTTVVVKDTMSAKPATVFSLLKPIVIQHARPGDQRGINVFESPKSDNTVPYTGFRLDFGAAFAQEFQGLQHQNTAAANIVAGVNTNQLMTIGNGFNTAVANGYLNAQVAPGIRVAMTSYLSARHHNESWVKDGYALIDASPIDVALFNTLMKYMTIKIGHFEINYGDEHFRRTDNGQSMFNPFVGNLITDAFTTEIGGEVYVRAKGFLAMGSITGGEVKGSVETPTSRAPAYISKLGYDKQLTQDLRVRLTGSVYKKDRSASNTLFTGDRGGSRYFDVLENTTATTTAQAWSGEIRPGFSNRVTAFVVNPFVKFQGIEVFGNLETATGKTATEPGYRTWRQLAGAAVYRFADDKFYAGYRYNTVAGSLASIANDVNANRYQLSTGWFINPMMLFKVEWVNQKYYGFPLNDIRHGGQFKGFMVESTLSF